MRTLVICAMPDKTGPSLTDEQLACQAQAGCPSAFDQLVRRYEQRIAHFLYRRLGHYHDAVDLAQETFLRAWRFRKTYRPAWRYSTWLFTIAARLAAEHGRTARPQPAPLQAAPEPATTAPDPLEQVADAELQHNLWAIAHRHLSDDQYQLLWLRYGEQFTIAQIAKITGRTAVSVKVQLMRARRALRPYLHQSPVPAPACPAVRADSAPMTPPAPATGAS